MKKYESFIRPAAHLPYFPMRPVERLTVSLPGDLAALIRLAVESGDFASASEVVREALRQWKYCRPAPITSPLAPAVEQLKDAMAEICQRHGVLELWAFGNALRAGHRAGLPLEFAVAFRDGPLAVAEPGRWALFRVDLEFLSPALHFLQLEEMPLAADGSVMHDIKAPRQRLYTAGPWLPR